MNQWSGEHRAPGDRIADRYLLVRLLEMGGMGSVWVAHHLALDVQVAIKFIRADVQSSVSAARLLQEARAAASLDHPAIVQVSDVGRTPEGGTYLVMELLDGEDVASLLGRETRLAPVTAVRVLLPILGALAAMHGRGMVHRDIKPENIFLSRDDSGRWQPKLIDFGLARVPDSGARLTQRGFMVGTPDYMSPERIRGEDADPGDDLWALSVVLYEMITGALPFPVMLDLIGRADLLAATPRSTVDHGAGDDDLWAIVHRGLGPRAQRWSSARGLGKAFSAWLWKRGSLDDITGVSLRPSWLGEDDVRRLSAPRSSLVQTARFDVPFRTRGMTAPGTIPADPEAPTALLPISTPPAIPVPTALPAAAPPAAALPAAPLLAATPPGMAAPRATSEPAATMVEISPATDASRSSPRRLAVIVLAAMAAGAVAVTFLRRGPAGTDEPAPSSLRSAPPTEAPTASPRLDLDAGAHLQTLPTAETSAAATSPTASSNARTSHPRTPHGAQTTARPTDDLKDPFH